MKRPSRVPDLISLRDAREGVAAVEFALCASLLVSLFVGAVSLGLASWTKMQVGNAARAGAAYAATHDPGEARFIANVTAAAQNATALSTRVQVPPFAPVANSCTDPASGQISPAGKATTCPVTKSPPGTYVTVATTYSYSFILPVPGIANTVTLSGKAVARIQ